MEPLDYCKQCKKRTFDRQIGIICNLTYKKPTFTKYCSDFEKDPKIKDYNSSETNLYQNNESQSTNSNSMAIIRILLLIALIGAKIYFFMTK